MVGYGISIFQEQWMEFAKEVAGLSVEKAKSLRIAMGKKHSTILNEFTNGLKNNSIFIEGFDNSMESIGKIWNDWFKSAPHLLKKSFAYLNAIVAYQEMTKKIMIQS